MSSVAITVICLVVIGLSHKHPHECIHDDIADDHIITQQHVPYKHDPLGKDNNNHQRDLLEDVTFEPIRIHPYYDPKYINNSILTTEQISYIKSVTSAAIYQLESFVSVQPVDGPLFLDRCLFLYFNYNNGEFAYPICTEAWYEVLEPPKCILSVVPDDHYGDSWAVNATDYTSKLYAPGGKGIADTDLIIYVTYSDQNCGWSTLAWAAPCDIDQYGRPIAGAINFCPRLLEDEPYWKYDVAVTLHELTHVMIMSRFLWENFYDREHQEMIPMDEVYENSTHSIISPKVTEIAQDHYNCSELDGVYLENYGQSSHWEAKYMQYEYMNALISSAKLYVSKFTLGLMEDSGWYDIDYNYAEPFTWGQNEGCQWFVDHCIDNKTGLSNFPQYFCESNDDNGCSFDYTSIGYCMMVNVTGRTVSIPNKFRYYTDGNLGLEAHDYCAFRNPVDRFQEAKYHDYKTEGNITDFEPLCWDERGNELDPAPYQSSYFGRDARCVDTLNINGTKQGFCFKHECIDYDSTNSRYNAIEITINTTDVITCYRNQTLVDFPTSSYSSLVSIKCPNIDAICGTSSKPFSCYWGTWNDQLSKCICSVGYIGDDCNEENRNYSVSEAMIENTPSPTNMDPEAICIVDYPTTYFGDAFKGEFEYDGMFDGYPVYSLSSDEMVYIYFFRVIARWQIDPSLGAQNASIYCSQYGMNGVADIETCQDWYFYNGSDYSKGDIEFYTNKCPTDKPIFTTEEVLVTMNVTIPELTVDRASIHSLSKIIQLMSMFFFLLTFVNF